MSRASSRLSQVFVNRLVGHPGSNVGFHWDSALPGFGIRVLDSGRGSWVVQYRTNDRRQRRQVIGDVRRLSLAEAKGKAREILAQVALGSDPQADRRKLKMASRVIDLIDVYLEDAHGRRKPRSYIEIERSLRRSAEPLHHFKADQVGRRDIVGLLNRVKTVSGPFAANHVRAYLSAMWTWGLRSGLVEGVNPVSQTPFPAPEKSRDRVLSDAELALIWRATADGGEYNRIVRLLMLTAQRRDEVGAMQWNELSLSGDQPVLILPASRTKNSRPHEVPLCDLAVASLPNSVGVEGVFGRSGVR